MTFMFSHLVQNINENSLRVNKYTKNIYKIDIEFFH